MTTPQRFQHHDLVFAQVKGHPYWPAMIYGAFQRRYPKRNSFYRVFFYGTHDVANVKAKFVIAFSSNKKRLQKKYHRRKFLKALAEAVENPNIALIYEAKRNFSRGEPKVLLRRLSSTEIQDYRLRVLNRVSHKFPLVSVAKLSVRKIRFHMQKKKLDKAKDQALAAEYGIDNTFPILQLNKLSTEEVQFFTQNKDCAHEVEVSRSEVKQVFDGDLCNINFEEVEVRLASESDQVYDEDSSDIDSQEDDQQSEDDEVFDEDSNDINFQKALINSSLEVEQVFDGDSSDINLEEPVAAFVDSEPRLDIVNEENLFDEPVAAFEVVHSEPSLDMVNEENVYDEPIDAFEVVDQELNFDVVDGRNECPEINAAVEVLEDPVFEVVIEESNVSELSDENRILEPDPIFEVVIEENSCNEQNSIDVLDPCSIFEVIIEDNSYRVVDEAETMDLQSKEITNENIFSETEEQTADFQVEEISNESFFHQTNENPKTDFQLEEICNEIFFLQTKETYTRDFQIEEISNESFFPETEEVAKEELRLEEISSESFFPEFRAGISQDPEEFKEALIESIFTQPHSCHGSSMEPQYEEISSDSNFFQTEIPQGTDTEVEFDEVTNESNFTEVNSAKRAFDMDFDITADEYAFTKGNPMIQAFDENDEFNVADEENDMSQASTENINTDEVDEALQLFDFSEIDSLLAETMFAVENGVEDKTFTEPTDIDYNLIQPLDEDEPFTTTALADPVPNDPTVPIDVATIEIQSSVQDKAAMEIIPDKRNKKQEERYKGKSRKNPKKKNMDTNLNNQKILDESLIESSINKRHDGKHKSKKEKCLRMRKHSTDEKISKLKSKHNDTKSSKQKTKHYEDKNVNKASTSAKGHEGKLNSKYKPAKRDGKQKNRGTIEVGQRNQPPAKKVKICSATERRNGISAKQTKACIVGQRNKPPAKKVKICSNTQSNGIFIKNAKMSINRPGCSYSQPQAMDQPCCSYLQPRSMNQPGCSYSQPQAMDQASCSYSQPRSMYQPCCSYSQPQSMNPSHSSTSQSSDPSIPNTSDQSGSTYGLSVEPNTTTVQQNVQPNTSSPQQNVQPSTSSTSRPTQLLNCGTPIRNDMFHHIFGSPIILPPKVR